MFGLSKAVSYTILGTVALGVFALLFYVVATEEREPPVRTASEEMAYCALSKMTVKMKRAKVMSEHRYIMATIKGQKVKYINPSEDRTFVSLVKSCLPKEASKQEQIDATNRLGVVLAYDEEYQRLMAPMKREQDRAMQQRR